MGLRDVCWLGPVDHAGQLLDPLHGSTTTALCYEHHEVITDDISDFKALDYELPAVRDSHDPSYVRQEQYSLLSGVYENQPKLWATGGIPPEFGQELLAPDMQCLEDHLLKVMESMPAFGNSGINTINNGPMCFPLDGCPIVGPGRSHPGLRLAAGFPVCTRECLWKLMYYRFIHQLQGTIFLKINRAAKTYFSFSFSFSFLFLFLFLSSPTLH